MTTKAFIRSINILLKPFFKIVYYSIICKITVYGICDITNIWIFFNKWLGLYENLAKNYY